MMRDDFENPFGIKIQKRKLRILSQLLGPAYSRNARWSMEHVSSEGAVSLGKL
jgi:hypothetical protein